MPQFHTYFAHSFYLVIPNLNLENIFRGYWIGPHLALPQKNRQVSLGSVTYKKYLLSMKHLNKEDHNTSQNMTARVTKLMQRISISVSIVYDFPSFHSNIQFC